MQFDVSLKNEQLYSGCEIRSVGGRLTLTTPPGVAADIIGANARQIIEDVPVISRQQVVLTGPMAVWAYLIVFHIVVHRFTRVIYDDGRGHRVLIAQH